VRFAAAWAEPVAVPAATLASHHAWLLIDMNCRPSAEALQAAASSGLRLLSDARSELSPDPYKTLPVISRAITNRWISAVPSQI
jgi:hypothetical protein